MKITLPTLSLVVLIGASGSGKSTFARRVFKETEVITSDYCRALVSDDENSLEATSDAFDVLQYIVRKRLKRGNLTVIDATNVQREDRHDYVRIAREFHVVPVAIILDMPDKVIHERNEKRTDRGGMGPHVASRQLRSMKRGLSKLKRDGFRYVYTIKSPEDAESVEIIRERPWTDRSHITGPFDIIGDIHGCFTELKELLEKLGYQLQYDEENRAIDAIHPEGRTPIFLGDLCDRGPATPAVLRLVMGMTKANHAICVPGNHDEKLKKYLMGRKVQVRRGLETSVEQMESEPKEFHNEVKKFLDSLISHYVLDEGRLVVAHAGMKEEMAGRASGAVRTFALFGETTGEIDEFGLPVRYPWAESYRGKALIAYGHTPVPEPLWLNNTVNIDTGCVFGGALSALRYPENEIVSIQAKEVYAEPVRPLIDPMQEGLTAQQQYDDMLWHEDVSGKRVIHTDLFKSITVRESNAAPALEIMSRFAADTRWLVYMPPTMSPCATSSKEDWLERPEEAFEYFQKQGVEKVICQEKHMGSRAVVIVCKTNEATRKRFGIASGERGVVLSRTGRRFFKDIDFEQAFIDRLCIDMSASNFWERHDTEWAVLDCELMPWSAKAKELLQTQYASVAASGSASISAAIDALQSAQSNGIEGMDELLEKQKRHLKNIHEFREAYRHYCWPTESLDDYRLAPFHLMATEGHVYRDKDHLWHMSEINFCIDSAKSKLLQKTNNTVVNLSKENEITQATQWWEEMTSTGGEGMVVKPMDFIHYGDRGLTQPALKVRGQQYLRIIYGPDYTDPEHLKRLRKRGLGGKRAMALREFALGLEALNRFVRREPLRRVHECVFGVLAFETEPLDPRL